MALWFKPAKDSDSDEESDEEDDEMALADEMAGLGLEDEGPSYEFR